jgi:hypothetical protein
MTSTQPTQQQLGAAHTAERAQVNINAKPTKRHGKKKSRRGTKSHLKFRAVHLWKPIQEINRVLELISNMHPEKDCEAIKSIKNMFRGETQMFTFRLYSTPSQVTSGVAGTIVTTVDVTFGSLPFASQLASIFDEFRIVKGEIIYFPYAHRTYDSSATGAVPSVLMAVMDYDSAGALASYTAAWRDTCVISGTNDENIVKFEPKGQPDLVWETTATTTTVKGTWKAYADRCSISSTYGRLQSWFDVEFRAVN